MSSIGNDGAAVERTDSPMRMTPHQRVLVVGVMVTVAIGRIAAEGSIAAIHTSPQSRVAYLARATIWQDPGGLSPNDLLEGPSDAFSYIVKQATADEGLGCTFTQPGKELGGNSLKFLCRTADGRDLRLKYWDPQSHTGNREVFAAVAASRLMWALGFEVVPAVPIMVRCNGCPENPMQGSGTRRARRYVAMFQARWPMPILSGDNVDQGWSWRELDTAIRSLPLGVERSRQRTYFDALTLLGVFMQHGDRKAEQQRLYCDAVNATAGELRAAGADLIPMLFERPNATACLAPEVTILDVGATFGGAGHGSNGTTAKMNLEAWQREPVFKNAEAGHCRGNLTVSYRAGHDGEPDPVISEEGRRFLLEQLHRLTTDHVRALFRSARVDQLGDGQRTDGSARTGHSVDAWVTAFEDKVRQIEARRCQPGN
jgi:hypothetical protein